MNMLKYQHLFDREGEVEGGKARGEHWQDKGAGAPLSAASYEPATSESPALKKETKKKHSTKRQTVFAAGWIDPATDTYVVHRTGLHPKHSRSKIIAEMLRERAQMDIFAKQQEFFAPIIRETIRAEFRWFREEFTNRYMALIARIAYQVSQILHIVVGVMSVLPGIPDSLAAEAEREARKHITRRTPQLEEVIGRLKQEVEDQN
jgi:hypothetical protein